MSIANKTYDQIIDAAYEKYTNHFLGYEDVPQKDWFINEIKTNNEFATKWGLKIEERELTMKERIVQFEKKGYCKNLDPLDWAPEKLILISYNNETIEVYE